MCELIAIAVLGICVGFFIYRAQYGNKEKPKIGIKRESFKEYFSDYTAFDGYVRTIFMVVFGVIILLAVLILEIVFY